MGAQRIQDLILTGSGKALGLALREDPDLPIDAPLPCGEPPVVLAARRAEPEILRRILAEGAAGHARAADGRTALETLSAVPSSREDVAADVSECARLLIGAGAETSGSFPGAAWGNPVKDVAGRARAHAKKRTGLTGASVDPIRNHFKRSQDIFDAIDLERRAWSPVWAQAALLPQLGRRDARGRGPLHHAVTSMRPDVARWLLGQGADPRLADHEGSTPLHLAARAAFEGWVGADGRPVTRESPWDERRTARKGRQDIDIVVEALLAAGADPGALDRRGRSPLDLASKPNHPARLRIVKFLASLDSKEPRYVSARGGSAQT